MKFNTGALSEIWQTEVLIAALKDKKNFSRQYEGKFGFQIIPIEFYKQPKTTAKKGDKRLLIVSIGVDVVAKTDDEIFV